MTSGEQWDSGSALMRGLLGQLLRLPITIAIWGGLLVLCHPALDSIAQLGSRSIPILMVILAAGVLIPAAIAAQLVLWKFTETFGFEGPVASMIGYLFVCAGAVGGYFVALALGRAVESASVLATVAFALETSLFVTWGTWINPT